MGEDSSDSNEEGSTAETPSFDGELIQQSETGEGSSEENDN